MLAIQASYSLKIPNSETRKPGRKAHRQPRPRTVQRKPGDLSCLIQRARGPQSLRPKTTKGAQIGHRDFGLEDESLLPIIPSGQEEGMGDVLQMGQWDRV